MKRLQSCSTVYNRITG